MKINEKHRVGENLLYFMVWTAIILVPLLNAQMMSEIYINMDDTLVAWRKIAPYLTIFIIHNAVLAPKLMLKRKYGWYILANVTLVITVFAMVMLYEVSEFSLIDFDSVTPNDNHIFTDGERYWNIVFALFMTGANSGIKLIYKSIRDEQVMTELKRQNLQAEMDYLKYQINPHFFMNTLNNIHALIDINSEYAKNAVIELSKMMRYVLYESGSATIPLRHDIEFLNNYVGLMRIRYPNDIDIKLHYTSSHPAAVSIPPLLLIVFVENAFKHGISYDKKSFIQINIMYYDGKVECLVVNSRHSNRDNKRTSGIGLDNVKKRLELIYGADYTLKIVDDEPSTYEVKLIIPTLNA